MSATPAPSPRPAIKAEQSEWSKEFEAAQAYEKTLRNRTAARLCLLFAAAAAVGVLAYFATKVCVE